MTARAPPDTRRIASDKALKYTAAARRQKNIFAVTLAVSLLLLFSFHGGKKIKRTRIALEMNNHAASER